VLSGVEVKPISSKLRRDARAGPCAICSTGKGGVWRECLAASTLIGTALPRVSIRFAEPFCSNLACPGEVALQTVRNSVRDDSTNSWDNR
jgi:hypothetical protein